MPQSLSRIIIHIVFGTKHRLALISKERQEHLYAYIAGICRSCNAEAYRVGGTENHVHIACRLPRTITVARLVEVVKSASSKWMKEGEGKSPYFQWQDGYGAFSISPSHLVNLINYIDNQEEHHRGEDCAEEMSRLHKKYS